ncbi:MAG: cryptochrome/photolyase family protein, partial [Pseudomonadota bacterium]
MADRHRQLLVILGNQLFPLEHLEGHRDATVFMAEDLGLCTYVRHHQQKIVLFLAAMRAYRDRLIAEGFDVRYHELEPDSESSYEDRLAAVLVETKTAELLAFEVEDRAMETRLEHFAADHDVGLQVLASPMFVTSRTGFTDYVVGAKRPFMAEFYKRQRRRLNILVDEDGNPTG